MPVPDTARTGVSDALHRGLTDDLRLAHLLADDADSITMSRFRSLDLHVTSKPDLTPVSDADTTAEQAIRRTLGRARPRDAVHGEEMADTGCGPRRWVIDPIDGPKNFAHEVPVWATLIALMIHDEPAVGVVSAPALGRRWWASLGGGAYAGKCYVGHRDSRFRCGHDGGCVAELCLHLRWWSRVKASSSSTCYDDAGGPARTGFWSYMLLAQGGVDIASGLSWRCTTWRRVSSRHRSRRKVH